jgi:hypothetical protein
MTFAVTGAIAYIKYMGALKQDAMNELTGILRSKAFQIEAYYRTIHSHVLTLSEYRMFIEAMREFRTAYRKLDGTAVRPEVMEAVVADYRINFYPQMQQLHLARPCVEGYLPFTPATLLLQYAYIVKNPYPAGRRREMDTAHDGSDYSRVHAKISSFLAENH